MSGLRITAAVITLNEAQNIAAWLAAHAWADERLVVDGGSADETTAIARSAGARVIEGRFEDFAQQRNRALDAAVGDWVLFADADERPSLQLPAELRRRLPDCRQDGFRIRIRSSIFGRRFRFCGTQDDCRVRLVRRGCGRWTGEVHEVLQVASRSGELAGWLDHVTLPDVATMLAKIDRYTTLAARARVKAGKAPQLHRAFVAPARETARRLFWKQGWLDGPQGWKFCLLSGLSEWQLERKHRELWRAKVQAVKVSNPDTARHRSDPALATCSGS